MRDRILKHLKSHVDNFCFGDGKEMEDLLSLIEELKSVSNLDCLLWNDAFKNKPDKDGEYLVERCSEDGQHKFFTVCQFHPQNVYETVYYKEYKQHVRVLVESRDSDFSHDGSFVVRWMEIPA